MNLDYESENFSKLYKMLENFIEAVTLHDKNLLKEKYKLIDEVIDELYETLHDYYDEVPLLEILPLEKSLTDLGSRKALEIYNVNKDSCSRIELSIVVNKKVDEPIFHFEVCEVDNELFLTYLYIGS